MQAGCNCKKLQASQFHMHACTLVWVMLNSPGTSEPLHLSFLFLQDSQFCRVTLQHAFHLQLGLIVKQSLVQGLFDGQLDPIWSFSVRQIVMDASYKEMVLYTLPLSLRLTVVFTHV